MMRLVIFALYLSLGWGMSWKQVLIRQGIFTVACWPLVLMFFIGRRLAIALDAIDS